MEKSVEKSEQQAEIIKMIAFPVLMLDVEYCREAEPDNDRLKMVVEVASRLYVTRNMRPERCAKDALELITACEEALKEVER